ASVRLRLRLRDEALHRRQHAAAELVGRSVPTQSRGAGLRGSRRGVLHAEQGRLSPRRGLSRAARELSGQDLSPEGERRLRRWRGRRTRDWSGPLPLTRFRLTRAGYPRIVQAGLMALAANENRQLIAGIISLATGVLIFLVPRLLNYIVAAYLVVVGILLILNATD